MLSRQRQRAGSRAFQHPVIKHTRHQSRVATRCCCNAVVATRLNPMQLDFPGVETPGYQQTSLRDECQRISFSK